MVSILPILKEKYETIDFKTFVKIVTREKISYDYYPMAQKICKQDNIKPVWKELPIKDFIDRFIGKK